MDRMNKKSSFASDNYTGACPEVMEYLEKANEGYASPYGDDEWTAEARSLINDIFEKDCEVFFVNSGTAANALSLASICQPYHSIICHELSHIEENECRAVEFYSSGAKLLLCTDPNGKMTPESIEKNIKKREDIHYSKPKAISLTQATEVGTVYTPGEIGQISEVAKRYNLKVHMDGARFANAVVSLGASPKEITWQNGVDVLSFGGTKNGLFHGEAIVFFDRDMADEFIYRCKQSGQIASKMRFISSQWVGLLKNDVWLKNAEYANKYADELKNKLTGIPNTKILFPIETNAILMELPEKSIKYLYDRGWHFYIFIEECGIRLMCSWKTEMEMIDKIVEDIKLSVL